LYHSLVGFLLPSRGLDKGKGKERQERRKKGRTVPFSFLFLLAFGHSQHREEEYYRHYAEGVQERDEILGSGSGPLLTSLTSTLTC